MAFTPPKRKPSRRFIQPSMLSFIIFSIPFPIRWERMSTTMKIAAKAIIPRVSCAIVSEKSSLVWAASQAENLNPHHMPSSRPTMLIICFTNPLNAPHIAAATIITAIIMSMVLMAVVLIFFKSNSFFLYF